MPTKVIGRCTIEATQAHIDALTKFVTEATDLFGTRIDPFKLTVEPRGEMPVYGVDDDGTKLRAEGHWSERRRWMRCADDLFGAADELKRDKTLGHEFVHVLSSDWLGKWHRKQLLPLLTPPADTWNDLTIGDTNFGYYADPFEAYACWGSAAIFGWDKPAYAKIYKRKILASNFAKTKTLSLATAP